MEEVKTKSKEKKYRGIDLENLKQLNIKESAAYLPARSRRSVLRHPEILERFIKSCEIKISRKKKIKTHKRDLIIIPKMVGMKIGIYDGKSFQELEVDADMIGHRLGEFALTRKRVLHSAAGIGATKSSRAAKK